MKCPKCPETEGFKVIADATLVGKLFDDEDDYVYYKQEETRDMSYVRVICKCGANGTPEEFGIDEDKIQS